MPQPTPRLLVLVALVAATALGTALFARQATSRPAVQPVRLPLALPAMGNIDAVKQWRFGRIELAELAGGSSDVTLQIRMMDDRVVKVISPRVLVDLARASNWLPLTKARPDRETYVERMIAFDADENGRLIAMISLEPVARDESRLKRVFGR